MDITVQEHRHDGVGDQRINIRDLEGFIRTVSTAPSWSPRNFIEQFAIYKNATTYRFYWYDTTNKEWRYAVGA